MSRSEEIDYCISEAVQYCGDVVEAFKEITELWNPRPEAANREP